MQLKGLFVGIDNYKFGYIPWLRCAKRDAVAMHALFTDTLGGKTKLLFDKHATKTEIEKEIQELANSSADDIVVIYFSGHGPNFTFLVRVGNFSYTFP